MKILFLVKYYVPFDRGGSEWSTHDLAKLLVKSGHKVTILTPNYGSLKNESKGGEEVIRLPFPKKLINPNDQISPWWTSNTIWFIYSSLYCLYLSYKRNFDLIHIQNTDFLPAGAVTSFISRIPSVATFRDYQPLCTLGFCLLKNSETCNLLDYFRKDFKYFYKYYADNKSAFKLLFLLIAVTRVRIIKYVYYFFAKRIQLKIAVSEKVKKIYASNGIHDLKVVHNAVLTNRPLKIKNADNLIYVGKLSKGKGIDLLMNSILLVFKKNRDVKLTIIGSGHMKPVVQNFIKINKLSKRIKMLGHLGHNNALSHVNKSKLSIVSSLWQEPLPRSAIESLLIGVPVVSTNVGGLAEVVQSGKYGLVTNPNPNEFAKGIIEGIKNNKLYRANIKNDAQQLKKHYSEDIVKKHIDLYKSVK